MAGDIDQKVISEDVSLADRFEQVINQAHEVPKEAQPELDSPFAGEEKRQGAMAVGEQDATEMQQDGLSHNADLVEELELEAETPATTEGSATEANAAPVGQTFDAQLDRYFEQIKKVVSHHQQQLTIAETDNQLLTSEIDQIKAEYEARIAGIERHHRESVDRIADEVASLKGENTRLKNEVASLEIENSLLTKNFQLQEDNLSHLKREMAESAIADSRDQVSQLTATNDELSAKLAGLEQQFKEASDELSTVRRELDDEADQKNALISRFRAEIATLEEKHSLQLERKDIELQKQLLTQGA